MKFILERVENTVGKGENAGYQHFLLFPQCFQKAFYTRSLKMCGEELRRNIQFLDEKTLALLKSFAFACLPFKSNQNRT